MLACTYCTYSLFFAGDGLAPTRMLLLLACGPDVDALALLAASKASLCASSCASCTSMSSSILPYAMP